MTNSLGNTPDFVCSVSMERTARTGTSAAVRLLPVHFDTGVLNGRELCTLPATEEEKTRFREVLAVYDKAGTGSFALFSRAVFLTAGATFYDAPDETKDGQRLSRVEFTMPPDASTYVLNKAGRQVTLGYSGSIWTDPGSLDVVRLALKADNIPSDLGIKAVTQIFEFSHAKMAGNTVAIPAAMELTLEEQSGQETRLTGQFSDCHQYLAKRGEIFVESAAGTLGAPVSGTVSPNQAMAKGSPGARLPKASPEPAGPLFPANLVLETILAEAIDERTTTQGSKLSFTLSKDVKKHGNAIVPKGATLRGHITRIIQQEYSWMTSLKRYYLVGLQLDGIVAGDQRFQVRANLESLGPPYNFPTYPYPPYPSYGFVPFSHDPNKWGTFDESRTLFTIPEPDSGESFLGVVNEFLRLPDHLKMYWSTLGPGK
ncbi:MAG: hypothetical protein ABSH32_14420 [Bryobacteraceae bacterium]